MGKRRSLGHVNTKINDIKFKQLELALAALNAASVGFLGEFNIEGDILETNNRSIFIKGEDNHLILEGTDADGLTAQYYFKVEGGELKFLQTGSLS